MMNLIFLPKSGRLVDLLAVCSSVVLLSACANFSGIQSTAQLKTLNAESNASVFLNQHGLWPDANWAKDIGGTDLQELIAAAMVDNPSIQIAAARVNAAAAMTQATAAAEKPAVNASFTSTYQRFTEHGMIPPPLAGSVNSDNQLALNFVYELDFWGKHTAEIRSAISQEKAALAEQQSARLILSNAIARAWVQLARQYAQLDLSNRQLEVREKIDALTHQRMLAGLDTASDIQQSLIQIASLHADILQWQETMALTRHQLAALLGQGPERGQSIARPVLHQSASSTALPAQLPLELLGRRPDIVAARWRVEAMQGEIDQAKTQFYPNINLVGFAGLSSLGVSQLFQSGSRIAGVGPAIRLPIFEGGRLRAQLTGRVAAYDSAVATYNQSLTDALHEVADQVQSLQAIAAQEKNQGMAEQAAKQTISLAQQRQQIGTANALPVLAAESVWITQQKILTDMRLRRIELHINLIKALGGAATLSSNASPDLSANTIQPKINLETAQ